MRRWGKKEGDQNYMDKEVEFLPILQKLDSLSSDVEFLIEKLKQIENDIKEIRKEVLEI
jgi:hypothetical protein